MSYLLHDVIGCAYITCVHSVRAYRGVRTDYSGGYNLVPWAFYPSAKMALASAARFYNPIGLYKVSLILTLIIYSSPCES
jgi:hypothetical protein